MSKALQASVIINNHNYGRFLKDAIESALSQTYPYTEVIVVDDGSIDNSRGIIADYGDRVIPILKENGGQGSAFNAGLASSRGEVILFLDSDDMLLPTALGEAVPLFSDPEVVKVHWRLRVVDEHSREMNQLRPGAPLPEGDLREAVFRLGLTNYLSAPTSGNAWSRHFLERIFPVPEIFRQGADTYLFELAPFFGVVRRISEPQSLYRKHGKNFHALMTLDYKLRRQLAFYESCCTALSQRCHGIGSSIDLEAWRQNSWWHRHALAVQEIASLPWAESPLILVDDASWEVGPIAGRHRFPFLEKDGHFFGSPPDNDTAVRELERLRQLGAKLIVFAWPAFWWLEHYASFHSYLRSKYPSVLENERLIAFEL